MTKLTVSSIPKMNLLVLKQLEGKEFFISTQDSIIISIQSLAFILKFLVDNNLMSTKVLEGILEEYYTDKGQK